MDSQPSAKALHNRINTDVSQLLQRFENIMATATVKLIFIELLCNLYQLTHSQVNNPSYTSTAVETYQLDVESTALIRASEDILGLTRTMKETWLFGKIDTLGENERDVQRREKLEEDAQAVKKAIDGGLLLPSSEK
ncbi:uncharacterized protein N7506_008879 [Penicillium brevicompactum]|uniref:uncharacterized protein n=1 Tax=Penicillium brevicompactum TaxID=5074 RepID=UPI002541D2E8|nr:uncharacterized protein N7506_008879 [Penicillium brevicompactum]KAJ5325777.1 hypothetical protein N7506_008879 [Penicillium brevicompactum]